MVADGEKIIVNWTICHKSISIPASFTKGLTSNPSMGKLIKASNLLLKYLLEFLNLLRWKIKILDVLYISMVLKAYLGINIMNYTWSLHWLQYQVLSSSNYSGCAEYLRHSCNVISFTCFDWTSATTIWVSVETDPAFDLNQSSNRS